MVFAALDPEEMEKGFVAWVTSIARLTAGEVVAIDGMGCQREIADLGLIEKAAEWASLQGLVRIESERYHKVADRTEREIRYYSSSLPPDAARLNQLIRQHGGIENKLHWVLDVGFGEDLSRKRTGHAAQNFSILHRIALNLLRQDKTTQLGIKGKRLKAAWNQPYLLKLLGIRYAPALGKLDCILARFYNQSNPVQDLIPRSRGQERKI